MIEMQLILTFTKIRFQIFKICIHDKTGTLKKV